jgi:transcriptional regulator with XRE-family HTH domain
MLIYKPIDIAQIFRLHRKQRGISQAKIAEKTETRQEMVSKLENNPEKIRLKELMSLISALDLELYVAPKPRKLSRRRWDGDW